MSESEAETFKEVALAVNDDSRDVFKAMNALASVVDGQSLSDPPSDDNNNCGVIGCWFNDGSFAALVVDLKNESFFVTAHPNTPEALKEGDINKRLRVFLSDEILRQYAN